MRGVAAASRVWSTAAMNIGSITALNSAPKDAMGAAAGRGMADTGLLGMGAMLRASRLVALSELFGFPGARLPLHEPPLDAPDHPVEHKGAGRQHDDAGEHRVDVEGALGL